MGDGGKGDRQRPAAISQEELKERWETIFPPKKKEKPVEDITVRHRDCTKSCSCMGSVESKCRD